LLLSAGLLPFLPAAGVIALVGAGGKTSALFALGEELAGRGPGCGVLLTTTTHLFDPRLEPGRTYDRLVLAPGWEEPAAAGRPGPEWDPGPGFPDRGRRIVLAAGVVPGEDRLRGLHPSRIAGLARDWAFVLVEADGAKRRPVKAPAAHEPVLPPTAGLVLGVVGLDCLGQPMAEPAVHRPELFGALTGCAAGAPIRPEHLAALCTAPLGLFKGVPAGTRRVLLLNKADRVGSADGLLRRLGPCADAVLLCALGNPVPEHRVLAVA